MDETENKETSVIEETSEQSPDIESLQKQVLELSDSNEALDKRVKELETENLKLKASLESSRENTTLLLNRFATKFTEEKTLETAEDIESQILAHYR